MPNRILTESERAAATRVLKQLEKKLTKLSAGDPELLFAFRRKIYKELTYQERSKPAVRRKLKAEKRAAQKGLCAICRKPLPASYCVLDRFVAWRGYTAKNTRLICELCDKKTQAARRFK